MHKNTIWYAAILLVIYFTLVFCDENIDDEHVKNQSEIMKTPAREIGQDLLEFEGRTRRHRHMFWWRHIWPIAIAYWIKVKVIIVSFFVGSAIYLGFRYLLPQHHRCNQEIILDHPPPSFHDHHDHIPYSLDHSDHYEGPSSYDSSSFDPYSAYGGYSSSSDIVSDIQPDIHSDGPTAPGDTRRRGKRDVEQDQQLEEEDEQVEIVDEEISESVGRQQPTEEQIAEFMFAFLGLDSKACRRRFVCEMEFRSKLNPLTSMAFRIVGRGFFEKYTNANNPEARATSFQECAAVNPECVFVETDGIDEESTASGQEETSTEASMESQNEINLKAERRSAKLKNRRGDRMLSPIAEHIMMQ
ncbi:uncharacterized protein Dwil_GK20643 [Drosophila willistoni]|uniref:Uncharacterized protein n=1 Tax=Drosophila willistoni TaxID=7260 RepID=B4MKA8_DROWI|nr:uncharacterized protein LOC6638391 [Drosophila willistoni]EDW72547.1 uncharacterized protein Dwil_GK20643 [Drosophila willistoni]